LPQRVQTLRTSVKNTRPTAGTREPGELWVSFPDFQLGFINAAKVAQDLVAVRFFSAATNYAVGDFVIEAGRGYRAKVPIVSKPFDAADWETITVSGEFEPPILPGTTTQYWRGDKTWQTLDKNAVGLSNVDNTSDANKPVSGPQQTALNLKANIASPTFTGDPKAPTPAYPDNDTSIATTAFVSTNFASLISPALGGNPTAPTPPLNDNDTSIATTAFVQAELLDYAPLASPTFTGDPKAPTPIQGDNDTSIATTAFVTTAVAGHINDAPSDANAYGRKAGNWVDVAEEAPADGVSYGRKNGNWVASVGGAVVSDTPPPGPLIVGQLWYEADSGNTYLWYTDADSSQWVQVNVQPAPPAVPAVTGTAQSRNRLVNGAMQVSQENGNTVMGVTATYAVDQWQTNWVSAGVFTSARVQVATPNGSVNRLRLAVTTADTSLAATDFLTLSQKIEGIRVADFKYGTAGAVQSILRFGFKAPAGTYSIFLQNSAANRSYVQNFTITAANTDTVQTLIIPGDITGTWLNDTGVGLTFGVAIAAGTTFQTTAGAWAAGSFYGTATNTNGLTPVASTYELYDVGLYLDPANTGKAPDWVMPDEAEELRACQRYWEITGPQGAMWSGNSTTGATYYGPGTFKTPKRVDPSLSLTIGSQSGFPAAVGTIAGTGGTFREARASNLTQNGSYFYSYVTGNARM
jgi:hypothetical protein